MPLGQINEAKLVKELAVHVVGYLGTIEAAWPGMVAQGGGVIVNTASGFGGSGPGLTGYMAAKSAVFSLTRDVALKGAAHNIRCNSIVPAANTRMAVPYWGADQTHNWDPHWATTLALYLASSLSAGVTGRQLSLTAPGTLLREIYVSTGLLTSDEPWTPELLAARVPAFLQPEPGSGPLRLPPILTER